MSIFRSFLFFILVISLLPTLAQTALYSPSGSISALANSITTANSTPDDDIIDLGGLVYVFASGGDNVGPGGTLSALPTVVANGTLSIINGTIQRAYSLTTATPFRLIYNESGDLRLYNLTLVNGYIENNNGGALYNDAEGTISLVNCTLTNNAVNSTSSSPSGGALYNLGTITTLQQTTIANNTLTSQAGGMGGGIANFGTIDSMSGSTIANNAITLSSEFQNGFGGGLYNDTNGTINSIFNSTFSGNTIVSPQYGTGQGGGFCNLSTLTTLNFGNNTIFGNMIFGSGSGSGGGVQTTGTISFNNNTASGNTISVSGYSYGGGLYNGNDPALTSLISNIIAYNTVSGSSADGGDIYIKSLTNEGYNLLVSGSYGGGFSPGATDISITSTAQLGLGALQNNGGPTFTMALQPGSFAINNGSNAPNAFIFDQRGPVFLRVCYGITDIGAYEFCRN